MAGRRDKGSANAPTFLRAHGDVLEIRVRAGQTTGNGSSLSVVCMNAAGARVDALWQFVAVGILELGDAPIFE